MSLEIPKPIIYLITSGATTNKTTSESLEFSQLLTLIKTAVSAEIPLVQIREKALPTRVLYQLTERAAELARDTATNILVNDRFDVAIAAGADGVQLTSQSLQASIVRRATPDNFLVGVSTHSVAEAQEAKVGEADFILFGPVFETESKRRFGAPQGLSKLGEVAATLGQFPVIAIGGITIENVGECLQHGAAGIAAIRLLNDPTTLSSTVGSIRLSRTMKNNG